MTCAHFLEFQRPGERRAGEKAARFLCEALDSGGVAVAIATPANARALTAKIAGHERFTLFDSAHMLGRFATRAAIDAARFDATVGAAMREAMRRADGAPVHAFGDMVGVLWQRDERELAVELEHAWQVLQGELGFSLYCAYPIDVFGVDFCSESLDGVLSTHSHLTPVTVSTELGRALDRAIDDVLGPRAIDVRTAAAHRRAHWAAMPKLESMIIWLRDNAPQHADAILMRARRYYDSAVPRVYLREEHSAR